MVIVGFDTRVIILVDSVTSTCFRSSFGDIRVCSGPMGSVSSGTLPGQISRTCGASPAAAVQMLDINASRRSVDEKRITMGAMILRDVKKQARRCLIWFRQL